MLWLMTFGVLDALNDCAEARILGRSFARKETSSMVRVLSGVRRSSRGCTEQEAETDERTDDHDRHHVRTIP